MQYPLAAHTIASEVPVLPPVYSTTVSPGLRRPSASARERTALAMRSLMLPVGFSHSSLTKIGAQSGGTTLRNCTSEVLPIASRMCTQLLVPSARFGVSLRALTACIVGDGASDRSRNKQEIGGRGLHRLSRRRSTDRGGAKQIGNVVRTGGDSAAQC